MVYFPQFCEIRQQWRVWTSQRDMFGAASMDIAFETARLLTELRRGE